MEVATSRNVALKIVQVGAIDDCVRSARSTSPANRVIFPLPNTSSFARSSLEQRCASNLEISRVHGNAASIFFVHADDPSKLVMFRNVSYTHRAENEQRVFLNYRRGFGSAMKRNAKGINVYG